MNDKDEIMKRSFFKFLKKIYRSKNRKDIEMRMKRNKKCLDKLKDA